MRTRTFALVVVFSLAGCKKELPAVTDEEALFTMEEIANEMCRCTDKACADRVHEARVQWATNWTQNRGTRERPNQALMEAITESGTRYGKCAMSFGTRRADDGHGSGTASGSNTRPPAPAMKLSTPGDRPSIATLIQEAKGYTRSAEDELVIHILRARHVREDGELDPKYGELAIGFGNRLPGAPRIEDDPDRPTGAPIPEPTEAPPPKRPDSAMCPDATWTTKAGWSWSARACFAQSALTPKCSMADVWKLAKAEKGTTIKGKAVAIIELVRNSDESQSWEFSIRDELRKVDISARIPDTCTPVAEKP